MPYAAASSPIDPTQEPTIREYCWVERLGNFVTRLGKRYCSGFRWAAVIQAATASRDCSVISNCTGRWVFCCRYDTSFGLGVVFVMADMNGSSVEGKEPHVDLD